MCVVGHKSGHTHKTWQFSGCCFVADWESSQDSFFEQTKRKIWQQENEGQSERQVTGRVEAGGVG